MHEVGTVLLAAYRRLYGNIGGQGNGVKEGTDPLLKITILSWHKRYVIVLLFYHHSALDIDSINAAVILS